MNQIKEKQELILENVLLLRNKISQIQIREQMIKIGQVIKNIMKIINKKTMIINAIYLIAVLCVIPISYNMYYYSKDKSYQRRIAELNNKCILGECNKKCEHWSIK